MRDLGGDGRLRGVYKTVGQALAAHPLLYVLITAFGSVPIYFYIIVDKLLRPDITDSATTMLQFSFITFITLIALAIVSAFTIKISSLPATVKIQWPDIYATLKKIPFLTLYFLFYVLILFIWGKAFNVMTTDYSRFHYFIVILWFIVFFAFIFILPAFFFIFPPLYLLEEVALTDAFLKSWALGQSYRGRIIGYYMGTFTIGVIALSAVVALGLSAFQWDKSGFFRSWVLYTQVTIFWMLLTLVSSALYTQLRHARGDVSVEDVADIFK
jgi:hypothetical protein